MSVKSALLLIHVGSQKFPFLTPCWVTWTAPPAISAPEVIISSAHSKRGARASIDEDLLFESFINLPFSCHLLSFRPLSRTDYAAMQKWQTESLQKKHYTETNEHYWLYRTKTATEIKTDRTNSRRGLLKVIFQHSQPLSSKLIISCPHPSSKITAEYMIISPDDATIPLILQTNKTLMWNNGWICWCFSWIKSIENLRKKKKEKKQTNRKLAVNCTVNHPGVTDMNWNTAAIFCPPPMINKLNQ